MTTISEITNPQVVAINGRIHDDPTNPYECEVMQCPFRPSANRDRFVYELFVRQKDFDFVILGNAGQAKYLRKITPSKRMEAVHDRLAQMFDETPGADFDTSEFKNAVRRHQASFDPRTIDY
jgi:hypothetical protein